MKLWDKTKKFYKEHKRGILAAVGCISCFDSGFIAKDIYDNYTSKKALDNCERMKLSDGTVITWF